MRRNKEDKIFQSSKKKKKDMFNLKASKCQTGYRKMHTDTY